MKALTNNELDALLAHADSHWLRTAILIGYRHGMRAQEITGLLRADVDLKHRTITLRRLKRGLTTEQKLSREEHDALTEQFHLVDLLNWPLAGIPYVFPSERGQRMAYITFWRHFRHVAELAGIPRNRQGHTHGMRHALGFTLVSKNVTLPIIKQALGHTDIRSALYYTQPDDQTVNKALQEALR